MPRSSPDTLALSRRVLRLLIALNQLFGVGIALLLVSALVERGWTLRALGFPAIAAMAPASVGLLLIMVLGIASVVLAHIALVRLLAIVDTVTVGSPFVAENAERLRGIGWAVLGMELLHLGVGLTAAVALTGTYSIDIDWSFSATRWLAVLLLFVLARVFEQGTRMREDLDGTI